MNPKGFGFAIFSSFTSVTVFANYEWDSWPAIPSQVDPFPPTYGTKTFDECDRLAELKLVQRGLARCVNGLCVGISYTDVYKSSVVYGSPWGSVSITCSEAYIDGINAGSDSMNSQQNVGYQEPVSLPISIHPRLRGSDTSTTVDLMSHGNKKEIRPRVGVRFLNQDNPTVYSLMLDTGCHFSYVRIASSNCPVWYGYKDKKRITKEHKKDMKFGTIDDPHQVEISRRVDETLSIPGSPSDFKFSSNVDLAEVCSNEVDTGLLGAGRGGPFSLAAGTFAYLPSRFNAAGHLLIGSYSEWSSYCRDSRKLFFFNLIDEEVAKHAWAVWGSTKVQSADGKVKYEEGNKWVFDTGASNLYVPSSILANVRKSIRKTGSDIYKSSNPREFDFITNCGQYRGSFPIISIAIGHSPNHQVVIQLQPTDYTGPIIPSSGECQLHILDAKLKQVENGYLFGIRLLSRVFTIFNEKENMMGMCIRIS